jgi:hypothetical protein
MMDWRNGTLLIMAVCTFVLLSWDIIVALNKVPNDEDTESGIIMGWFKVGLWPIAWAWGVLGAHLVMPGVLWKESSWVGISALVLTGVGLLALGLWATPKISHTRWRVALRGFGLLQLGILEGWLFFPQ